MRLPLLPGTTGASRIRVPSALRFGKVKKAKTGSSQSDWSRSSAKHPRPRNPAGFVSGAELLRTNGCPDGYVECPILTQLHCGETFGGDQLVIHVIVRGNAVTLDHRQSQMDQPRTVGVYFMRDRADER